MQVKQILLIRMLGLGDVTCIGIPAIRYFKQRFPDAKISFLTFAAGQDIIRLAEPDVEVLALEQWPENIVPAMEAFLGLAEDIVGVGYDQIVNLDTWFMPCFMSRFLKDAGEPVLGNVMNISVQDLIEQFQNQTLKPEYVNDPAAYMDSSFMGMSRWHTPWWESAFLPDNGYPEFYLRSCCSFDQLEMNWQIDVKADHQLKKIAKKKKVIALAPHARTAERHYPHGDKLKTLLEQAGFHVWTGFDGRVSMRQTLAQLKSSHLLVTAPSAPQWLAATVGCPSLVICGDVDPRTLMPDYATDQTTTAIAPEAMLESIESIFAEQANEEH
ncbi:glycosyltransferase family 9 protein [Neptunicella sp.]|uniref:glycosyltransferase family 9 protein n=1 Tax=Neptunicella sp. TaxID=2125986 RepID=UPI003F68CA2E